MLPREPAALADVSAIASFVSAAQRSLLARADRYSAALSPPCCGAGLDGLLNEFLAVGVGFVNIAAPKGVGRASPGIQRVAPAIQELCRRFGGQPRQLGTDDPSTRCQPK